MIDRRSFPRSSPSHRAHLQDGIQRFNQRQFFECHEVLEAAWLTIRGPSRDFYKGLIQAAVSCYHWSRGNTAGAISLSHTASRYLKRYCPAYLGVDVERFLRDYHALFASIQQEDLSYNADEVPKIYWRDSNQ